MREHLHYDDDAIFNRETHHETSDVNVRALLIFVACFIIFGALTHGIVYAMFSQFRKVEKQKSVGTELTGLKNAPNANVPAEPRLQPFRAGRGENPTANTPVTDMDDMRASQNATLETYGWVDRQKGVVHIPIEDAKKLALQRGFAVAPPSAPAPAAAPVPPAQQQDASGGQQSSGGSQQ